MKRPLPSQRHWLVALGLAMLLHLGMWWLPVALPPTTPPPPRIVRIDVLKMPTSPTRRPKQPQTKPRTKRQKQRSHRRHRLHQVHPKQLRPKVRPRLRPPTRTRPPTARPSNSHLPTRAHPSPTHTAPSPTRVQRTAPPTHPPPPRQRRFDLRAYGYKVYHAIQRQKRYPMMAYQMGFEGVVMLLVQIDRKGRLLEAPKVVRSSGYPSLDQEAIRMVKAAKIPPFPRNARRRRVRFRLPVSFRIEQ